MLPTRSFVITLLGPLGTGSTVRLVLVSAKRPITSPKMPEARSFREDILSAVRE
jgi:hypothetical protein